MVLIGMDWSKCSYGYILNKKNHLIILTVYSQFSSKNYYQWLAIETNNNKMERWLQNISKKFLLKPLQECTLKHLKIMKWKSNF